MPFEPSSIGSPSAHHCPETNDRHRPSRQQRTRNEYGIRERPVEADRSRVAARCHQRGRGVREVDPARPFEHPASMVGAAAPGHGARGDLCADGQRSLLEVGVGAARRNPTDQPEGQLGRAPQAAVHPRTSCSGRTPPTRPCLRRPGRRSASPGSRGMATGLR